MGGRDGDTQKLVRGLTRAPAACCASPQWLSAPRAAGEAGGVLQGESCCSCFKSLQHLSCLLGN